MKDYYYYYYYYYYYCVENKYNDYGNCTNTSNFTLNETKNPGPQLYSANETANKL